MSFKEFFFTADIVGYIAGLVTIWGMFSRTIIPLRIGVICGNLGFITFGIFAGSDPTAIVHGVLLPINTIRFIQLLKMMKEISKAHQTDLSLDVLLPYMKSRKYSSGQILFRKNDSPDSIFIIQRGNIFLEEFNITISPGEILGEMAFFHPQKVRTSTAICQGECTIASMSYEQLIQIYYQNPKFGISLIRLIVKRLIDNLNIRASPLVSGHQP